MKDGILGVILAAHHLWLDGNERGACASLRCADLSYANLRYADLSGADLSCADLSYANLSGADLSYANLCGADLRYANLSGANLRYANLSGADLRYANLSGADLRYAYGNGSPDMACLQLGWLVVMTRDSMAIGCQQHTAADWWVFDDDRIAAMDSEALSWWRVHKPILHALWAAKWGESAKEEAA